MNDLSERPRGFGVDFGRLMRPALPVWRLTVAETSRITPRAVSVSFTGESLGEMTWRPGEDLVLELPALDGAIARRHYTIRAFSPVTRRLDIDFVVHGDSPAVRWAMAAKVGEAIAAGGPRGRTRLAPEAAHHLFLGDETAIPAIFAMAESMAAGQCGQALIEAFDPAEAQPLHTEADVEVAWVFRESAPPMPGRRLIERLEAIWPDPAGAHAYVLGETGNVRAQRHWLLEHGFSKAQITAEGYWRPGRIGGHDHV